MGQDQSTVDGAQRRDPRQRSESSAKKVNQIVVVANKTETKKKVVDEDMKNLRTTKLTRPILGNNAVGEIETIKAPKIVSGPLTEMILRYQYHLTECAEAVSFDQGALTKQIKETDALASRIYKSSNEKNKACEKAISQIETVKDLTNTLRQIENNMSTKNITV
ncbi:BLOC-1-related complex subunit 5-like [Clytia hemisphaerica]|uniref:BLOC-1-related complex subunit 5-like n=1 Tax=Clytia hemisphaerica TaxID=252671 RepID=UPI0034D58C02